MTTVLAFAFVITILVFIHELGHFLAARWFRVPVETFSIGFGPAVARVTRGGIEYRVGAIPFGGYVKMAGMARQRGHGVTDGFDSRSPWQRFAILLAGPAMNIGFALVLTTAALLIGVELPSGAHPVVTRVAAGGAAEEAGLRRGDVIEAINGTPTTLKTSVASAVSQVSGTHVPLAVTRDGAALTVVLPAGAAFDAVSAVPMKIYRTDVATAVGLGATAVVAGSIEILQTLGGLVTGQISPASLIGPVGLAQVAGESSALGWRTLLAAMAFISLNLGICNLLPIPILDGGHMLMLLVEGVTRRDLPFRLRKALVSAGALAMLFLLFTTFYNDLGRLGWLPL